MQTNESSPRCIGLSQQVSWLLAAAIFLLLPSVTQAANVTVDCTGGPADYPSITAALNALDLIGPHTITLLTSGPCNELVRIVDRDRVRIQAPNGVGIVSPNGTAPIVISNSHGIILFQVGPTGSQFAGIRIDRQSEVAIEGSTVAGNGGIGIRVIGHSRLQLNDTTVRDNGGHGLGVDEGSLATLFNVLAHGNALVGIRCSNGASCFLNGFVISENNSLGGLIVTRASSAVINGDDGPNTFQGNGNVGIAVARNSSLVVFGANRNFVQNNPSVGIDAEDIGSLALFDMTVSGNAQQGLTVLRLSLAEIGDNNIFTGNGGAALSCDATSLLSGQVPNISPVDCMRIERTKGPPRPGNVH